MHASEPAAISLAPFIQALQSHLDTVTRSPHCGSVPNSKLTSESESGAVSTGSSSTNRWDGSSSVPCRTGSAAAAADDDDESLPNGDQRTAGQAASTASGQDAAAHAQHSITSARAYDSTNTSTPPLSRIDSRSLPPETDLGAPVAPPHLPPHNSAHSVDGTPSEHLSSWPMALASWKLLGSSAASSAARLAARLRVTVSKGLQGVDGAAVAAGLAVAVAVVAVWMVLARKHVRDALWR